MKMPVRRTGITNGSSRPRWVDPRLAAVVFALMLIGGLLAATGPFRSEAQTGVAANLTRNWSFETFEGTDVTQRVAQYWVGFQLAGSDVEFRQGTQFAGAKVERIDGLDSQIIKGDEPYDAGVYQIVSGLRAGQWYSAIAYVLSVFQTSAVQDPTEFDGTIVKQIGIDPAGGRNPLSPSIIWGEPIDKNMDRATWGQRLTLEAQGPSATFYIRVQALQGVSHPSYDNIAFIDGAQVRLAPVSQAIVPEIAPPGPFEVSWKSVVPNAYAAEATVIEFDVQFRDGLGPWQDWLSHTTAGSSTFALGTPGHEYSFRVRGWARYTGTPALGSYAELYGPWAESAAVRLGRVIRATAHDNRGFAVYQVPFDLLLDGTVVSTALTDGAGDAFLADGEGQVYSVGARDTLFKAPPPIHNVVIGPGISPVGVTLLPPDDVVPDGSFEASLPGQPPAGWSTSSDLARVTDYRYHAGLQGIELSTDIETAGVCMARTFEVTEAYLPVLAFWYRLEPPPGGMSKVLRVRVLDSGGLVLDETSLQSDLPTDWLADRLHVTANDDPWSAPITVEFCLRDPEGPATTDVTVRVYVDDISLGSSAGGRVKAYLPCPSARVAGRIVDTTRLLHVA